MKATGTFTSRRRGLTLLAAAGVGTPVGLFLVLKAFPSLDGLFESVEFHLFIVSVIAACAVGIAGVAAVAAARSRDCSLVIVAGGCLGVGILMLAHGLVTPGIGDTPYNLWVGRLPNVAIALFAASQVGAVLAPSRSVARFVAAHPWWFIAGPAISLGVVAVAVVLDPTAGLGSTPLPSEETLMATLRGASMFTLALVGVVHWRRWRLSGDSVGLALSIASLLSAEALVSLAFGRMWHLSWWDYHALLLLGFGSAVTAVMLGFLRTRGGDVSLAGVYMKDPLHHIARGYPEALKTLVTAAEVRDVYTHGHARRVTELAARIGQKMGLPADELRKLVWGAELHDIGKIGIPDHIINKEGPLTTDERRLIEEHPVIGWEIARQARSLDEILGIVRWHHERVDGTGYPDGLSGNDIPLAARIVAVADVWDALTSDRSYRPAWESAKALEVMTEGRGTQFDEACLDAFLDLGWSSGLFESEPASLEVPVEPGVSIPT